GTPLSLAPPGTWLRLLIEAAASGFAPVELLAFLKHPLTGPGEGRAAWLGKVRALDLKLRGVRPARGLQAVRNRIWTARPKDEVATRALVDWFDEVAVHLRPIARLFQRRRTADLAEVAGVLREAVAALSTERFWDEQSGRAAADLIADLEEHGGKGGVVPSADLPSLLAALLARVAVRPLYGTHPRLSILGLLEARLQRSDIMILGGLNEGVWPSERTLDPWLPPKVRRALGLPLPDRSVSLAAHDFAEACGASDVLLTRSRRDASAPRVPSRFWLRLQALLGEDFRRDDELERFAAAIDMSAERIPATRPQERPPVADRPKRISVTRVEILRADPYQIYAGEMLRLRALDPLGQDAGAAERGTMVHAVMERLAKDGAFTDETARAVAIDSVLKDYSDHPLLAALWRPRVDRMVAWATEEIEARKSDGWQIAAIEEKGGLSTNGVTLTGTADIVFGHASGLAVADYKTGGIPAQRKIADGYADQLALLAWMAEDGAIPNVAPQDVIAVAYWQLSGGKDPGRVVSSRKNYKEVWEDLPAWISDARDRFAQTVAMYLTGDAPFK
ncbi:MAG: PD-(D/E)XK nuclease family protein, partial [Pacificimonas sp.]